MIGGVLGRAISKLHGTAMGEEKDSRFGTMSPPPRARPSPLPPNPPVDLSGLHLQLDRANQALGRLDGLTTPVPDAQLFLYLYVRKEALLSSQIDGTKSSFSDSLLFENEAVPGGPGRRCRRVSNYVAAMRHGLSSHQRGFPLSLGRIRTALWHA
jgi:Fic family protein